MSKRAKKQIYGRNTTQNIARCILLSIIAITIVGCEGKIEVRDVQNKVSGTGGGGTVKPISNEPGKFEHTDPQTGVVTRKTCQEDEECGTTAAECIAGQCYNKDNPCSKITCNEGERCQPGTGNFENTGFCVPNCNASIQCGGVCKKNKTDICVNHQWVPPCSDARDHCIAGDGAPICCTSDTICVASNCVKKGEQCDSAKNMFCKISEYCDTTLDRSSDTAGYCIRYLDNPDICMYRPQDLKDVSLKLQFTGPRVFTTPIIADINDDGYSDIIGVGCCSYRGYMFALSGKLQNPTIPTSVTQLIASSGSETAFSDMTPAVADLDGDLSNGLEIVTSIPKPSSAGGHGVPIGINIFSSTGKLLYSGRSPNSFYAESGAITIGDIDADGIPEIVATGTVYSNKAKPLFEIPFDISKLTGSRVFDDAGNLLGDIPILADVNLDGYLDLIDGQMIFYYKKTIKDAQGVPTKLIMEQPYIDNDPSQGKAERPYPEDSYSAVGYFQKNVSGYPQIVNTNNDMVYIIDHTGKVLTKINSPVNEDGTRWTRASAPLVADIDGEEDGIPEIGITFDNGFAVYKVESDTNGALSLRLLWYFKGSTTTTEITGGSVFDFDGDGIAEVLYNDASTFYILSGNGTKETDARGQVRLKKIIFQTENIGSAIWGSSMMPVVADFDRDGHADIIIAGTDSGNSTGFRAYSNTSNNWVPTRYIFNQHAYDVTNINNDGTVPRKPKKNWLTSWLNNYRQNVQEGNPFLASDLVADIHPSTGNNCANDTTDHFDIQFALRNSGSANVSAHRVKVEISSIQGGTSTLITTLENNQDIPANGGSEEMSYTLPLPTTSPLAKAPFDLKFVVDSENNYNECHDGTENVFYLRGISSKPSDVSVDVRVTDAFSCITNKTVPILLTVRNNGKGIIAKNTVEVSLYATIGSAHKKKLGVVTIDKEIPIGDSVESTFTWNFSEKDNNKLINIEAVVDENNQLPECNESNNTTTYQFSCQQLG